MTTLVNKVQPAGLPKIAWQTVAIFLAVGVLTASAKIQIPFYPVPITLQTLAVFAIGGTMGWRLGLASLAVYLVIGFAGMPVFAGNPAVTGGYLLGFVVATLFMGSLAEKNKLTSWKNNALAMVIASMLIYVFGVLWLQSLIGFEKAFTVGVLPFLLGDLVKIATATSFIAWWQRHI